MSEPSEPRVDVDGEEIVGCIAEDKSDGEQPASERAAIEEENRLAEAYADIEGADEEQSNADTIDNEDLEEDGG